MEQGNEPGSLRPGVRLRVCYELSRGPDNGPRDGRMLYVPMQFETIVAAEIPQLTNHANSVPLIHNDTFLSALTLRSGVRRVLNEAVRLPACAVLCEAAAGRWPEIPRGPIDPE